MIKRSWLDSEVVACGRPVNGGPGIRISEVLLHGKRQCFIVETLLLWVWLTTIPIEAFFLKVKLIGKSAPLPKENRTFLTSEITRGFNVKYQ
jgi:hypothetical protein